jgi:hypothetical protein
VTPEGEQVVPTPPVIGQEDGGIIVDAAPDVIIPTNDASPLEGDAS